MRAVEGRLFKWFMGLHVFFAVFLMSSWILPFEVQRIALWGFFTTYFIDVIWEKRIQNFKWRPVKWLYVAMIVFYLMVPVWQLFTASWYDPWFQRTLEYRLPFLGIGLIGLLGINKEIRIKYVAIGMLVVSVALIIYVIHKIGLEGFVLSHDRSELFAFIRSKYVNSHITFNLFLNISLSFLLFSLLKDNLKLYLRIVFVLGCCFIFAVLMFSEGRVGFFTALMLLAFFVIYNIHRYVPKIVIPSMIIIGLVLTWALGQHKRISTQVFDDPRTVIWEVCIDMVKDRPFTGYGVSNSRYDMLERGFADKDFHNYYDHGFIHIYPDPEDKILLHPHNIFIETAMDFGILGLLVLLFMLTYPYFIAPPRRKIGMFFFLFVICAQGMFESFTMAMQPISITLGMLLFLEGGIGEPAPQQSHGLQKQAKDIS